MKTRKFLLAATAAMTALLFGLTSCEDNGGNGGNGGLTLSPTNYVTLAPGESTTVTLNSDGVAVDAASVTWTSNAPEVFTIENGTITAIKVGKGTFTATYNNSSVTGDVVVEEEAPEVPVIEPVAGGITIAVYIPEGSDCYGAPLWGGDSNPNPWNGEEMVAVEGAEGWYKVDIAATTAQGKPLAHPEVWNPADEKALGDWPTQIGEYEILQGSDICVRDGDNFTISGSGLVAFWAKNWKTNPCVENKGFTFYIQVPECTPDDAENVYIVGSHDWGIGTAFPITDGIATVTINGQATGEWKVRLDGVKDNWSREAVECSTDADGVTSIKAWGNKTLGDAEGKTIVVEGWGENGAAIEGCLTDCAVTSAQ